MMNKLNDAQARMFALAVFLFLLACLAVAAWRMLG